MRQAFAAALSAHGLTAMALAVMGAQNDEPETVAAQMAAQVKAESDKRLAEHPLLAAAKEAGVETPDQMKALTERAKTGDAYLTAQRDAANAMAVVAFGVTTPEGKAQVEAAQKYLASAPLEVVQSAHSQYTAVAKGKGLLTADGKPKERETAARPLTTAADAGSGGAGASEQPLNAASIYERRSKANA